MSLDFLGNEDSLYISGSRNTMTSGLAIHARVVALFSFLLPQRIPSSSLLSTLQSMLVEHDKDNPPGFAGVTRAGDGNSLGFAGEGGRCVKPPPRWLSSR